ncbi:hypothetical protein [Galbibacter sp. PAP.153]|uniref:hypothetical protein n=1 Tax=Galbibacter sp. PAP.153 TaxID=3104623 RepID=UPI00300BE9B7
MRKLFHEITSEDHLNTYFTHTEKIKCIHKTPYTAAATMMKAKYFFWPFKKLSYFNKGKKSLEDYINKYPNDIEARYVRYLIQKNVPAFLKYDNKMVDSLFIIKNVDIMQIEESYKKIILQNL